MLPATRSGAAPTRNRSMETSKPPLPDAVPISNDSQETGLWLWRGEAPLPRPAPPGRPSSRIERVATLIISAARSARWMAMPLVALAVTLHLLTGGQSMPGKMPGNTSAAAPQPTPAPSLALPISPAPPAPLTEAPLDQAPAPSAPVTQAMADLIQHKAVKRQARHRPPITVRRSPVLLAHRWTPVLVDVCRYGCDWAEATAWHGGGY